jgi:hypothetical protein
MDQLRRAAAFIRVFNPAPLSQSGRAAAQRVRGDSRAAAVGLASQAPTRHDPAQPA